MMRVVSLIWLVFVASAAAAPHAQTPPAIVDAYKVAVDPSGKLLVADGGGDAGRIFRIDPRTGSRSVFAGDGGQMFSLRATARRSSLGHVTDVAVGPGGAVYAIASERVVRIDRRGRLTVIARVPGAIGLAPGRGAVYVTDVKRGRLLRVRSGRIEVIASGFAEPLVGVAVSPNGSVLVSSGRGNGRVESIAGDGSRRVLLDGLALAAFISIAPDGSLLVVDHVRHEQSSPRGSSCGFPGRNGRDALGREDPCAVQRDTDGGGRRLHDDVRDTGGRSSRPGDRQAAADRSSLVGATTERRKPQRRARARSSRRAAGPAAPSRSLRLPSRALLQDRREALIQGCKLIARP